MAILLGIDTGGTYTDAVLLDDEADTVVASAKSLTTRPDLSQGIGAAMDAVIEAGGIDPEEIGLVSLSTTLATNALIEGQGGKVALVLIGFDDRELARPDLSGALADDPAVVVAGGHDHAGSEAAAFDSDRFAAVLETLPKGLSAVAVAARFATRNPSHEIAARTLIRDRLGLPVTCSHDLSKALGGPKRAVTAVLNARLIGLIDRLIAATEAHMAHRNIAARLMVVRGDGALVSAALARERPVETILSGPAASVSGAQWLSDVQDAVVSDIGGTTTDICVLEGGHPKIDPDGAKVGPHRTMVEAVAMRTFGLGGDSEITVREGLDGGLTLGPMRVTPIARFAKIAPALVHDVLDRALRLETPPEHASRFVFAQWHDFPEGLDPREAAVARRLTLGPVRWADAVQTRVEAPALQRLVRRGLVGLSDITPTDAIHLLGRLADGDAEAATKALTLFARRRTGAGGRLAPSGQNLADRIVEALTDATGFAVLETAFADDGWPDAASHARHPLVRAGLRGSGRLLRLEAGLAVPLVGLGASAGCYYGAVGERLGTTAVLPKMGGVANAIGAVVGQIALHADGSVTSTGEGAFTAHLSDGPQLYPDRDEAIEALREALTEQASERAIKAGVEEVRITETLDLRETQVEAKAMFIEAKLRITARGRPRVAR